MRRARPGSLVDIFRGDQIDIQQYVNGVQRALAEIVPEGIVLRLFIRPQDPMHNRFVLSDVGGVSFQIGLDDDATGERPEDIVTVLQNDVWSREWTTYAGDDCLIRLNL